MKRQDFRFTDRLRVRWAEIDAQQIVFNGHYLAYFDTAVGGFWRALALPYADTMKSLGGDLFVRKATLEYLSSARYDDQLDIGVRCERVGTTSMTVVCAVFRGDELLVHGEIIYVFADPLALAAALAEAGARVTLVARTAGEIEAAATEMGGDWATLGAQARLIRQAVFVDEQKIPAELVGDGADDSCLHAVAFNRFGVALATGRLMEHLPGVAKIGRMAVLRPMRGGRIGREVLDALIRAGKAQGYSEVLLHAQLSAAGFYARAGFAQRGEVFEEAGIGHVAMVRAI